MASLHTDGVISEYFELRNGIIATPFAELFVAIDRSRSIEQWLWVGKQPLKFESNDVVVFLERMRLISERFGGLPGYGVDADGIPFCLLKQSTGSPILKGQFAASENERRFMAVLSLVSLLHGDGVVLGDIGENSFWVSRAGEVSLVTVLGAFQDKVNADVFYPEGRATQQADCYALSVLAQKIFSGVDNPPAWLPTILESSQNGDFESAKQIVAAISEARKRIYDAENVPVSKAGVRSNMPAEGQRLAPQIAITPEPPAVSQKTKDNRVFFRNIAAIGCIVVLLTVAVVWYLVRGQEDQPYRTFAAALSPNIEVATGELRKAIKVLASSRTSVGDKQQALGVLSKSDDPNSYNAISTVVVRAPSETLREAAESVLIERARRLGLVRTATIVEEWFGDKSKEGGVLESVIVTLDRSLPAEAAAAALRGLYVNEPAFALRLAAALTFDTNDLEVFQPVLSQLVGDNNNFKSVTNVSSLALIWADKSVGKESRDDVVQRRAKLKDSDLIWLLDKVLGRGDQSIPALANELLTRGALIPAKRELSVVLKDTRDLPIEIEKLIVKALTDSLQQNDVSVIGRWYDLAGERVLLAMCNLELSEAIQLEVFDLLAGRSITNQSVADLVEWIRKWHWSDRLQFVRAVGAFAFYAEKDSEAEIPTELTVFDPYIDDPDLVSILVTGSNPRAVEKLIERYNVRIGRGRLVTLLYAGDSGVRAAAIKVLSGFNDLGVAEAVIKAFQKEQNQELRQLYIDSFWFVKQRVQSGSQ